jgi:iron complex outermembrane receptor protein
LRRNVGTWQTTLKASERQQLSATVFFSDLYYQTPGALTKAEFDQDPRAARPAAGAFPSAQQVNASIDQQTFLAGVTNRYQFNSNFQNTTVAYGAYSGIKNSTFRNYGRTEPHFGGRSVFSWEHSFNNTELHLVFGGEGQKGAFTTKTFKNRNGNPDTILTDDAIDNWMYTIFVQNDLRFTNDWNITAGVSLNRSSIEISRLSVPSTLPQKRTYSNEWAPRLAISKKIFQPIMLYASVSKGFSPPTVQEVLPSTSVISTNLNAEHGINYEGGFKSSWLQQRLYVEVNAFYFRLKNTIVQRRDNSGGDYFVNAGATRQKGVESQVTYQLIQNTNSFFNHAKVGISHTYNHFRYRDFKQVNNDFSGKSLPSVAPHTFATVFDVATTPGLYANLSYFYSDPIALNDANSVYAPSYKLLSGRVGWRNKVFRKLRMDVFAGVDNLLDERYSLGNDINAAGGRYYNVAPGVNYFVGIALNALSHTPDPSR